MSYLLGLDLGSGRCKAALVAADGSVVRVVQRPSPLRQGSGGEATYDAELLAATALAVLRECVGDDGEAVAGVGVAGMAESGVPLDADGRPLAEVVAWFDPRGDDEADALGRMSGAAATFAATGLSIDRKQTLARLLWLRHHAPSVMEHMARWAGVPDFVAFRLTGALRTHPSLACRTLAYDLVRERWSADLLAIAGVRAEQMPEVRELTAPPARLRAAVASVTGLPEGIAVCVAGHDHVVGAYAAGILDGDAAADSMGTAEAVCVATPRPILHEAVRVAGVTAGRHLVPGHWYLLGGLGASGGLVEWLSRSLLDDASAAVDLDALLAGPIDLPTGIVMLPFLRGRAAPQPDPAARVVIGGLRAQHGPAELVAAALEGTSLHVRWMLERIAQLAAQPLREVRIYGGGSRLAAWRTVKANVNPWPTLAMPHPDAVAVGAALAAGVGAGVHRSVEEGARTPFTRGASLGRDPSLEAAYDRLYVERYLPLASGASRTPGTGER